ncbi:sulfate ABC transporter substrate-binding protein, partial [Streptomyces mutabilis]
MPATIALLRAVAGLLALPLFTLAGCGYGSQAKDDGGVDIAAGAEKIDGLDSVRIG